MQIIINSLEMGLIFSIMAMGIFITFKILNLPDLTVDGSYTLGAAISAVCTVNNHPFLGLLAAIILGALAGSITGLLHTKLKINPILAGILTMTGLYSVNLRIMGKKPTISIFGLKNIFSNTEFIFGKTYNNLIISLILALIVGILLYAFLKTQLGMSMIATGDNEEMVRASSINSDMMKIIGLAIGNALVALCGAVMMNYLGLADISGGTGMMIIGIASIIVGESILGEKSLFICFLGVIVGAIIYRYIIAIALNIGLEAGDLKLLSSVLVVLAIGAPAVTAKFKKNKV